MNDMERRAFLAALGATAAGAALTGCATGAAKDKGIGLARRTKPAAPGKALAVQPVLVCQLSVPREQTSWRPWGGLHTRDDVDAEIGRITKELEALCRRAEFPMEVRKVIWASNREEAAAARDGGADVMAIYGASAGPDVMEAAIAPERYNLVFVRHESGPVYLWYEIVHPHLLRKTVDEYGQPGLAPCDVVVDSQDDLLWRFRGLYGLKNTVGSKMVCIGGASGWGAGGAGAPDIARQTWRMELIDEPYEDLGKRIVAAKADTARVQQAAAEAADYLRMPGTSLETGREYVERAFLLKYVFDDLMEEAGAPAITVNHCMGTIMPLSETTACLTLSLINDAGAMAFCESDFAVIPSGVLLHYISSLPAFLQDPTYPHHGVITLAHCTAPRKMDGRHNEDARILTHFESDYGAAPKVNMRIGQTVTVIDPDFANKRWIGFRGTIKANPFLDICRSQIDVAIDGDCDVLAQEMRGFHWMLSYGDYLKETGYALSKLGIGWMNLSAGAGKQA